MQLLQRLVLLPRRSPGRLDQVHHPGLLPQNAVRRVVVSPFQQQLLAVAEVSLHCGACWLEFEIQIVIITVCVDHLGIDLVLPNPFSCWVLGLLLAQLFHREGYLRSVWCILGHDQLFCLLHAMDLFHGFKVGIIINELALIRMLELSEDLAEMALYEPVPAAYNLFIFIY